MVLVCWKVRQVCWLEPSWVDFIWKVSDVAFESNERLRRLDMRLGFILQNLVD